MEKISAILLNPMKINDEEKIDSSRFLENMISDSKELRLMSKLFDKELFAPSEKLIENILRKCDISVSH